MSRNNLFGVACRTCRRRGRKCDRSLPTCMSCRLRGVECEGYVLRWVAVDAAARGTLAGQTYTAPDQGTDSHPTLELRTPRKAKTTKAHGVDDFLHPHQQVKIGSKAEPPETNEHVTECSSSSPQNVESRAISIQRQANLRTPLIWGIPAVRDNLGRLIEYCIKTRRRCDIERG
jgi:Fungal Zn(2)-Cys(6) binuclear cluster domain